MGRHTSASRKLAPEISIDIDEILAGIDNSGLNIISETPLGDVTVDGTLPVYTGISMSNTYNGWPVGVYSSVRQLVYLNGAYFMVADGYRIDNAVYEVALTFNSNNSITIVSSSARIATDGPIRGMTTDGTYLYVIDTGMIIRKFTQDRVFVSEVDLTTLVPGILGSNSFAARETALVSDGYTLFVRVSYTLADGTEVGVVIFNLTLDFTLIRNTIEDTDYHLILDPVSNYSSMSNCRTANYGTMTVYNQKIWVKHANSSGSYAIRNYNLDFTPGNIYRANSYTSDRDGSGYTSYYGDGPLVFDDNGDVFNINYRSTRYILTSTDAVVRVTAPSIGLLAGVGDSIVVNNTVTVEVTQIESENVVQTLSNINPAELTNSSIYRLNSLTDKISLVKLSPMTYAYRS